MDRMSRWMLSSPVWIFAILLCVCFTLQLAVVGVVAEVWGVPIGWHEALFDAALLTLLFAGFVWSGIVRPLRSTALREREQANAYLETAGVLMFALDREGRVMQVNRIARETVGLAEDEILGRVWWDAFVPPAERESMQTAFHARLRDGAGETVEAALLTRSGRRAVIWRVSGLREAGPAGPRVLLSGDDVTQRRAIEQGMFETHERLDGLLRAIPSMIVGIDSAGTITHWNEAAGEILGVGFADVYGVPLRPETCHLSWDWERVTRAIEECSRELRTVHLEDVRLVRTDGRAGALHLAVCPLKGMMREAGGLLILGSDVSEKRFIDLQRIQAMKLESIGSLAAGIAHEINTPTQYVGDNLRFLSDAFGEIMTLVSHYRRLRDATRTHAVPPDLAADIEQVEQAERKTDVAYLAEEIPRALQQSLEGVSRVAKIVGAMREFSHPGTQEMVPTDLNRAIETTLTVSRNAWKYAAEMVTDLDPTLPLVPSLPDELNQAVLNVVVNAAHAIEEAERERPGAKGTITVSTRRDGGWAEIRIRDTGTGIPEAIRDRIFDPFFTTKEVGRGTGQGLALSRAAVVKKHGGTLHFETEVGKGTTFIIRLPLEIAPVGGKEARA